MPTYTEKFLQGGGKTGELIRHFDWSRTLLGEPSVWPESLISALSICLNAGFPIAIYWSEDLVLFYNDAYSEILGDKHPRALGKFGKAAWPEIWEELNKQLQIVFTNSESIYFKDTLLPVNRFNYTEECYFDYTLSPIIDAAGNIKGVFNVVTETTYRIINKRRNQILHELLKLNSTPDFSETIETVVRILETAPQDLPFSLFYTGIDKEFTLAASIGLLSADVQNLNWPFAEAFEAEKPVHIQNLSAYLKTPVTTCWPEFCTEALVIPLKVDDTNTLGYLIAGISPRINLNQEYQQFIESVANYIGTAIQKSYNHIQDQQVKLRILESENRFRSMMDQAPIAMAVFRGKEMQISKANQAMLNILDKTKAILGKNLVDIFPKIKNEQFVNILSAVYDTGEAYVGYGTPIRLIRNGILEEVYFDFYYSPLIEEGKITGVLEMATEVTERMKGRQNLQQSEALFRAITTASPTALWITDETGNISYVNETWISWTGKPLENHLGAGWLDAVCKDDVAAAYTKFTADFANHRYHESHFRIMHTNGQERWVICTGNPQFNENQHFTGFIGACVDITEQKQLQHQKDNFLGIASHELKTPVTSIKAYAQVLEVMFRRDGDVKKADMLMKLNKQVNRLSHLIADLLDVTKIHTGKMQFNESAFNFNKLVEEVIENMQHTSFKHTILKEFNFDGSVFGDADRISQVISNLLTNAIKYSPDAKQIIVRTQQKDGNMVLCVEDFGIGISQDKKDNVFEQFYRVSGTKEHTFPGLGLGLYISSEIVKRLNGKIWVNSTEGEGSVFCFSLPVTI